jgi:hypothetical protein
MCLGKPQPLIRYPAATEAECRLESARIDEIKIDEVLDFYERVLCNVPMLWKECNLDQPTEIAASPLSKVSWYHRETGYRTQTTCSFFSMLEGNSEGKHIW